MSPVDPRVQRLQQSALFGAISQETVAFVLKRATPVEREAGACFFREGDRGASVFWLEEGSVVVVQRKEGRDVEIRRLSAGDCFGEMAHLDFGPRSASVRALTGCRALEITSGLMREISARDLEQFTLLNMNLGRELARRLRSP